MSVPTVPAYVPEFANFIEGLRQEVQAGTLSGWLDFSTRVHNFFTPPITEKVNSVISGWRAMAAEADGTTLIHVACVYLSLLLLPEYLSATSEQRLLMEWIVLFHDVAKIVRNGKRDPMHAFRSAAMTAQQLPRLGFAVTDNFAACVKDWTALTSGAAVKHHETGELIPDNHKLPGILDGITKMYRHNTPGVLIVKTVLFHLSLNVVEAWPQAAALTDQEIRQYIDDALLPLLKMMMLVDNDAYAFFNLAEKQQARAQTLAAFEKVAQIIHQP